jgi:hypothetical protein
MLVDVRENQNSTRGLLRQSDSFSDRLEDAADILKLQMFQHRCGFADLPSRVKLPQSFDEGKE